MNLENAYDIIISKLEDWIKQLIAILPNLIVASVIIIGGLFAAKLLRKIFYRAISKIVQHKNLANLVTAIFHLILVGVTIFAALSVLKLDKTVTTLLAGAGVLGLALAFAFQDIAANFVSGVFITLNRPFRAGETIQSKGHTGVVEIVNLRDTVIRTFQGQIIRIPNKEIFQNPLINYTQLGKRRLDIEVGVSYNDDLEKAEQLACQAAKNVSGRLEGEEPVVFFKQFGESSIDLEVFIWLNSGEQADYLKARSDAIKFIKKAFDENGITIPFPIRTLDLGSVDTASILASKTKT